METPKDIDAVLNGILASKGQAPVESVLDPEDEEYLQKVIALVRSGKPAVLLVEETRNSVRWMLSQTSRPQAISMMARITSALTDDHYR